MELPDYAAPITARRRGDGFSLAVRLNSPDAQVGHIDGSGKITEVLDYAAPASNVQVSANNGWLDSDDHLYQAGVDAANPLVDLVVHRGGTASTVVYSEANAPKEAPRWTGNPPILYVKMHGSRLFTGP